MALFLTIGCRNRDLHDGDPLFEADRDTLIDEQKRANKGELVGEKLRAPKVVVTATDILVNDVRVAARAELSAPHEAGLFAFERVDALYNGMKNLREHWKQIFPARDRNFEVDVSVPADATFREGRVLLDTLAFAGYPNAMVHAPDVNVSVAHWVPRPPRPEDADWVPDPPGVVVIVGDSWRARTRYAPPSWSGYHEDDWGSAMSRGPSGFWQRCSAPHDVDAAALLADVQAACAPKCRELHVQGEPSSRFTSALTAIARAGQSRVQAFEQVRFVESDACGDAPHEAAPPPLASASDFDVKVEPVVFHKPTNGGGDAGAPPQIARDAVDAAVRSVLPRVRACLAKGRAALPQLRGRLDVRLGVGPKGDLTYGREYSPRSTLSDIRTRSCVVWSFRDVTFPAPSPAADVELEVPLEMVIDKAP
jgi:hypothetical protein